MKKLITMLALACMVQNAAAQFDTLEIKQYIRAEANAMQAAFRANDWKTFAAHTNEKVVEMIGGEEAYTKLLTTTMKELFEMAKLDTAYAGNILTVAKTPAGYQCLMESFIQMKVSDMMVTGVSYDVGTSADGKKWRFLRVDDDSKPKVKEFIPDISADLQIPSGQMVPNTTLEEFLKTYELKYDVADPEELMEMEPPPPPPPPPPQKVKKPVKKAPVKTTKPKTKPKS